jgi:hypothetical protein
VKWADGIEQPKQKAFKNANYADLTIKCYEDKTKAAFATVSTAGSHLSALALAKDNTLITQRTVISHYAMPLNANAPSNLKFQPGLCHERPIAHEQLEQRR